MTTDSRLADTSVAVMIVEGSSLVAMSLSFSTLASDRPCVIQVEGRSARLGPRRVTSMKRATDLDLEQVSSRRHLHRLRTTERGVKVTRASAGEHRGRGRVSCGGESTDLDGGESCRLELSNVLRVDAMLEHVIYVRKVEGGIL
jgi:hypothetical protein